jgi:hypothetical protein
MSGSPKYKIYSASREYVASCKYLEDCAALAALRGDGTKVLLGHSTVLWIEGMEEIPAGESYDRAAEIMAFREQDAYAKAEAKLAIHRPMHPGVAAARRGK